MDFTMPKNFGIKIVYLLQNEFDTQKMTDEEREEVSKAITVLELLCKKYKKPQEYVGVSSV